MHLVPSILITERRAIATTMLVLLLLVLLRLKLVAVTPLMMRGRRNGAN